MFFLTVSSNPNTLQDFEFILLLLFQVGLHLQLLWAFFMYCMIKQKLIIGIALLHLLCQSTTKSVFNFNFKRDLDVAQKIILRQYIFH